MSDIEQKLEYLNTTKSMLKTALQDKGSSIDDRTPFRDYVQEVENIKVGDDTSDATATANEIISPKTAYVKGQKITGSMPNNGELTYSMKETVQTIPAGYTSGGTISPAIFENMSEYNTCLALTQEILE